jgi:hypothetical protein
MSHLQTMTPFDAQHLKSYASAKQNLPSLVLANIYYLKHNRQLYSKCDLGRNNHGNSTAILQNP